MNIREDKSYNEACPVQTVHSIFIFKSHKVHLSGHAMKSVNSYVTESADSSMYRVLERIWLRGVMLSNPK